MNRAKFLGIGIVLAVLAGAVFLGALAQEGPPTSYSPVVMHESFEKTVAKMEAAKPEIERRQGALSRQRYDLADKPAEGVTMSRGKPVQEGVRVRAARRRAVLAGPGGHDARRNPRRRGFGPRDFCRCRTRTTPKAECCFPSSTSTRSSSRRAAT